MGILDKEWTRGNKGKKDIPLSTFGYLFGEWIQYHKNRAQDVSDLEERLAEVGEEVGIRMYELVLMRSKEPFKRMMRVLDVLLFISDHIFKPYFGKHFLEKSSSGEHEYMFRSETDLNVNEYINVPRQYGSLNCAAFVAGVIRGAMIQCGYPSSATAHYVEGENGGPRSTTILVKVRPDQAT